MGLDLLQAHVLDARHGLAGAEPEVGGADDLARGHEYAALDGVVEFADVAGPAMVLHGLEGAGVKPGDGLAVALDMLLEEMLGEERDVLAALAQWRQVDGNGVETEKQILAEFSGGDLGGHVGVRGRDEADIDAVGPGRADAFVFAGLERAQNLRLLAERNVADLVHEQRAAVRELEAAGPVAFGIGEGAAHVAEEFALEHALGQPAHVDGDEGLGRADRHGVQRLGDHALARAVFAGDENIGVGRADAREDIEHGAHRGGLGDEGGAALAAEQLVFLLEPAVGPHRVAQFHLIADDRDKARVVPRLGDEILRAAPHGLDRHVNTRPRGHDDDRQRGVDSLNLVEEIEALLAGGGVARVIKIHQHERKVARLDRLDDRGGRFHRLDLVTLRLQQKTQRFENVSLVVGNENPEGRGVRGGHCRRMLATG